MPLVLHGYRYSVYLRITRLARGIPSGAGVAHTDSSTLSQAMENRRAY